ncbi:MAG: hypothetical protein U0670_23975 [Anaerolineae bacterium]
MSHHRIRRQHRCRRRRATDTYTVVLTSKPHVDVYVDINVDTQALQQRMPCCWFSPIWIGTSPADGDSDSGQ